MAERDPISTENCTSQYEDHQLVTAEPDAVIPWSEARDRLKASQSYWVATVRGGNRPHVRPVLAVWVDGALYSTTNPDTRKGRNLAENPNMAIATSTDGMDLIVEGSATWVEDEATLQQVAEAYRSMHDWPVTVQDGAFNAPYGAPAAGPPPYRPYALIPKVVYGMGTNEEFAPRSTRWRFA